MVSHFNGNFKFTEHASAELPIVICTHFYWTLAFLIKRNSYSKIDLPTREPKLNSDTQNKWSGMRSKVVQMYVHKHDLKLTVCHKK